MTQPTRQVVPDPDRLLSTALRLAAAGVPVFPCVPDAKRPLTQHGLLDATTDRATIRAWWQRHPIANLAIPTGAVSYDVLDIDVRATGSGYPAFNQLARAGLIDGYARIVATPSGGLHIYYRGTAQPSSRLPAQHIDFKASGGYILTPPSVVDGKPYELIRRSPDPHATLDWITVRTILAPNDFRSTVTGRRNVPDGIEHLAAWVSRLPEGQRNAGTFWAACRAVEQGILDLRPIIDGAVQAGLPRQEAARTVTSAVRRLTAPPTRTAPAAHPATPRLRRST